MDVGYKNILHENGWHIPYLIFAGYKNMPVERTLIKYISRRCSYMLHPLYTTNYFLFNKLFVHLNSVAPVTILHNGCLHFKQLCKTVHFITIFHNCRIRWAIMHNCRIRWTIMHNCRIRWTIMHNCRIRWTIMHNCCKINNYAYLSTIMHNCWFRKFVLTYIYIYL